MYVFRFIRDNYVSGLTFFEAVNHSTLCILKNLSKMALRDMKLKTILKKLNRRNQKNLRLSYLSESTGMTKEECIKEKLALISNFSFLKKYATVSKPSGYWSGLIDPEVGGDYSHIRIQAGEKWFEYIDIYHHRGFLFDDGIRRTPQSWGIMNMATDDDAEFDTLEELKAYIEKNYEKYGVFGISTDFQRIRT